jgi:hypothetical protein
LWQDSKMLLLAGLLISTPCLTGSMFGHKPSTSHPDLRQHHGNISRLVGRGRLREKNRWTHFPATLRQHLELKPSKTEQNGSVATLIYQ